MNETDHPDHSDVSEPPDQNHPDRDQLDHPGKPDATLTRIQQKVLDATVFFIRKGELPTIREVAALVGRAPATVLKHLRFLERQGFLSLSGKSRGIRIANPSLLREVVAQEPGADVLQTHLVGIVGLDEPSESGSAERATDDHRGPISITNSITKGALRYSWPLAGGRRTRQLPGGHIPLVGAIAAGQPFESYPEACAPYEETDIDGRGFEGFEGEASGTVAEAPQDTAASGSSTAGRGYSLGVDPRLFVESGDLVALRVDGDSMVKAGILDGDYVIVRRQNRVEEGEIAAVIIDGEGTLKRWRTRRQTDQGDELKVSLEPENDLFDPIEISAADAKDVLVFGKYVGLIRGNLHLG